MAILSILWSKITMKRSLKVLQKAPILYFVEFYKIGKKQVNLCCCKRRFSKFHFYIFYLILHCKDGWTAETATKKIRDSRGLICGEIVKQKRKHKTK
jgi:hypothetical protein